MTAAVVAPCCVVAFVEMDRGFEAPFEEEVLCGVEEEEEELAAVERAVVEVPFWMAEWARNAARKLARKDRFVGIVDIGGQGRFSRTRVESPRGKLVERLTIPLVVLVASSTIGSGLSDSVAGSC